MHALIICSYYVKYNTKNYVKRLKQVQEKRAPWAQSYSHQRKQSYSPQGRTATAQMVQSHSPYRRKATAKRGAMLKSPRAHR